MKKGSVVSVVGLLAAAGMARAQWTDGFDRASGLSGWTQVSGSWSVSGNRGMLAAGSGASELQYNGARVNYQNIVARLDVFPNDPSLNYAGITIGLGGTDRMLFKLQGGGGTFSSMGIYHNGNGGGWTGTTTLPGGTTTSGGFFGLTTPVSSCRMTVWFPNEDVVEIDLDTNFDGIPDYVYQRTGVSTLSGIGQGVGVGGFGNAVFDNFQVSTRTQTFDSFNRADGALGGPWNILTGTWAVAGGRGVHTSGSVYEHLQLAGYGASYRNVVESLDAFNNGSGTQFSALTVGVGGTDTILVKLQNNGGSAYDTLGIYHLTGANAWGQWTGTTTLPGGGTSPNGFLTLPSTTQQGRVTVSFPTADIIRVDIDTNLDGVPDWTYTRDGVSSIAAGLGTGVGISAFGTNATFDNFNIRGGTNYDSFDRGTGALGGDWTVVSGTWGVDNNQGVKSGAASTNEVINKNNIQLPYADAVIGLDMITSTTALQYSGIAVGAGGSSGILIKLQGQTGTGRFSNIGLYNINTFSPWTGTTTLPDGSTSAGGFFTLPAEFASARVTASFPSADVLRVEIDTDFDGRPEYVYQRTGVSSIAGGFAQTYGIAGYGAARFDNFSVGQRGSWPEAGDAGELPGTADPVAAGAGALARITGTNGTDDADMFGIKICDPANFSATTVGTTNFDTQLFLFNLNGTGIASDDDNPGGGTQSTLTNAFTTSLAPGNYLLAISQYNRDPQSSGGFIWANTPFNVERAPDGPGAAGAVTSWNGGTSGGGSYTISTTGTCFGGQVGTSACYANCDGSTIPPVLNVNDFTCFLNRYAANDPYANCDGSTIPPVLNVNDFTCFLNKYAAGCP